MRAKMATLLLIAGIAGLLLAGCSDKRVAVYQADPETKELVIRVWAAEGQTTSLTVTTVDGDFSDKAHFFRWHYEVPAGQVEYLVKSPDWRTMDLYLRQDKAPKK